MSNLEFFKKQAKNFLKDWQTQIKTVESDGYISYHYDWKFYDVGDLFFYYELDDKDEQDIKLARAQHWISKMVGFKKWDDLIHASKVELELAELLLRRFKNAQDVQNWEETIQFAGIAELEPEIKLEYARQYYELGDRAAIVNGLDYKILTPTVMYGQTKIAGLEKGITDFNPDFTMNMYSSTRENKPSIDTPLPLITVVTICIVADENISSSKQPRCKYSFSSMVMIKTELLGFNKRLAILSLF